MEIRELAPPPWELLARLIEDSRLEGFRFLLRFKEDYLAGRTRFDRLGEVLLGAFEGPELVGICGLTSDPYIADPFAGRIRHLYIRRDWRQRGVGRKLVSEIEERARATFNSLGLRTDTASAAQFYVALGYTQLTEPTTSTHRRCLARPGTNE